MEQEVAYWEVTYRDKEMKKKIIFLDIDGVLATPEYLKDGTIWHVLLLLRETI